jgi:hypothetical protein
MQVLVGIVLLQDCVLLFDLFGQRAFLFGVEHTLMCFGPDWHSF